MTDETPTPSRSPTPTPTQTPTSTSTPTPSDGVVSVSLDALQPALVSMTSADSIGVRDDDGQYLFLDVSVEAGSPPDVDDFAFHFDGTAYDPARDEFRLWREYNQNDAYEPETKEGWLLFELPETGDASNPRLTWNNAAWGPDAGLVRRLSERQPSMSVSPSFPESVTSGASPTISIEVTNDGNGDDDLPGRFVAGLNRSGPRVAHRPVERISVPVPAGESETVEVVDDSVRYPDSDGIGDGDPDMTYYLDWPGERVEREVRLTE